MGICEERGSGVDKVVFQAEFYQLPAPAFEVTGDSTRSALFAPRTLTKMEQADRVRAVYLHACLRYVEREFMTNTTLRDRFGVASRMIVRPFYKQMRMRSVPVFHGPHRSFALERRLG
jgi:predicted HTH transcriptional regulator